ncbi:MAG: S8 family peptidase [Hyphomicrobiales bacterium]|nr:S8 family peptidase [Hyphomicrobiales bacterium]
MVETKIPPPERLPIKLILPNQGKQKPVQGGGSPPKPFRPVDAEFRRNLSSQVEATRMAVLSQAKEIGAAPIRIKLIPTASAKSHRPDRLFSKETCPIVGAGRLGELFAKATPEGLNRLNSAIATGHTDQQIKELSCIESIEPISPTFRRRGISSLDVLRKSPKGPTGFITRVRLFNLDGQADQGLLVENFEKICKGHNIHLSQIGYSPTSFVYGAECHSVGDVEALSRIVGVRAVMSMPLIRTLRPRMLNPKPLSKLITRADVEGEVPVVVVVDTGITDQNPALSSWIVGHDSYVAETYRNTDHGTFVAGLICWGGDLNPTIAGANSEPCAIFDLQVIPNDDPSKGDTEGLLEQEFLQSLESALQEHANEFKVWNLSVGTDSICSLDEFSEFAEELDNLQERYNVSFVISAGNYNTPPMLDYPRDASQLDSGRITTPADSVLGITVGSVSHVDYKMLGPKEHYPSGFSRHGAGPNHIIKPDFVHYGGSCSTDATHISGIRSINGSGTAENLGTSFAAPLVSRTLAQLYHQITPTPTPVLARALLTHHARDPRTQQRVPDREENFFGFGLPAPVPYCLECTPYTSTLIFDDVLRPGYFLEWDDFPYPASLHRNGRYFGEISMTVAFSPARGARWGSEYCETHIDAHFGVYRDRVSRNTGEVKNVFVGLVPPEHKNPGLLYESYQVTTLRKWAPVRTYHGFMGDNGERGTRWRLMVRLLSRHGVENTEALKAQPFSLIVTISDPTKKAPVYDEMARSLLNRFQSQNLAVRNVARIVAKS